MFAAVFFDRDGIINKYVTPTPKTKEDIIINAGIKDTLDKLRLLGYMIIIATNQPDVGRGLIMQEKLDEMNEWLGKELKVDAIYSATNPDDSNYFRKPNPGMFFDAATRLNIDLTSSFMVGDSWKDIEAGKTAGCGTIFLETNYNKNDKKVKANFVIQSLDQIYPTIFGAEYSRHYFTISMKVIQNSIRIQNNILSSMLLNLNNIRSKKGRLFIIGVGGGAGNASHAAADFRKIAEIEVYSVTDNISELTARINDGSWENSYREYLIGSNLNRNDAVMVFSVGGGSKEYNISKNIVNALDYAKQKNVYICGIVGRDGGYTKQIADDCIVVTVPEKYTVTPIVESMQSLIWHMLVTHPYLKINETTWELIGEKDDLSRQ